ncbi:MAG TPA: histidine triad nucleotide-binding protein [Acidimicrobiales bacterium]|nr:histidine triad nucleotide-binding protein [Acidimicrobiales bacterium]
MTDTFDDCVFCGIVSGSIPADVVFRSGHSVAFRDLNPQAPVHVLVVPIRHIQDAGTLGSTDSEALLDLFMTARQVADNEGVAEGGFRLLFNVGEDAQNSVPHLHLHVLGGRKLGWPPG